jgi:hypothetical protein
VRACDISPLGRQCHAVSPNRFLFIMNAQSAYRPVLQLKERLKDEGDLGDVALKSRAQQQTLWQPAKLTVSGSSVLSWRFFCRFYRRCADARFARVLMCRRVQNVPRDRCDVGQQGKQSSNRLLPLDPRVVLQVVPRTLTSSLLVTVWRQEASGDEEASGRRTGQRGQSVLSPVFRCESVLCCCLIRQFVKFIVDAQFCVGTIRVVQTSVSFSKSTGKVHCAVAARQPAHRARREIGSFVALSIRRVTSSSPLAVVVAC